MLTKHALIALGLGVALGAFSIPAVGQTDSSIVAEINGRKVTAAELEAKEGGKLLQAQYKYYLAQRDALEQFLNDEVVSLQAKKEGVSRDELFKRHVGNTIPEPTEDQLRFYYEGVQTEESFEAARGKIIETVHTLRMKKAAEAYVADLRGQYGVVVELSQPSAEVEAGDSPRIGSEKAPVQIVEYADYECPYCQKVNADLIKLREQFGNQLSLVYKDFPLPMHPFAGKAAEAAHCAGDQGKFWEFHDALFQAKKVDPSELKQQASALKLDVPRFEKCMENGDHIAGVKKDSQEGQKLGLLGTPSFFVNGHFMSGAISYTKLRDTVQQELSAASAKKQSAALTPSEEQSKQ